MKMTKVDSISWMKLDSDSPALLPNSKSQTQGKTQSNVPNHISEGRYRQKEIPNSMLGVKQFFRLLMHDMPSDK